MPLFKKNHKTDAGVNDNLTTGTGGIGSGQGLLPHQHEPLNTTGHEPHNATGPMGGYNQGPQPGTGMGYGGGGNPLEPRIFEGRGMTEPHPSAVGTGIGQNYGQQPPIPPSKGTGIGQNYGQQPTIPPSSTLNNTNQTRGGTGQRLTGKMEAAMGAALGSETLKARGYQKEQEANAIKIQGQELAEAERLEREAMGRRERAVGHGAHPANKQLGGGLHDQYS